ncbi:hypothetical protein B0H17DRAFT_1053597 [Mycena rosella]|uniref:Uncharacterized protein n=1 Tax=Mycena rosella TaxID=1033263 RepID=A0AAD7GNU7_MYCRO|nr:hypothetical protein B0H17DRAFT_1053597 [Mycena rosella]
MTVTSECSASLRGTVASPAPTGVCSPQTDLLYSSGSPPELHSYSRPLSPSTLQASVLSTPSMAGQLTHSTVPSSSGSSPPRSAASARSPVDPAAQSPARFSRTSSRSSLMTMMVGCSRRRSPSPGQRSCVAGSSPSPMVPSLTLPSTLPRPASPASPTRRYCAISSPAKPTSDGAAPALSSVLPPGHPLAQLRAIGPTGNSIPRLRRSPHCSSRQRALPSPVPTPSEPSTTASSGQATTPPSSRATVFDGVLHWRPQRRDIPRSRSSSLGAGSRMHGSCMSTNPSLSCATCLLGSTAPCRCLQPVPSRPRRLAHGSLFASLLAAASPRPLPVSPSPSPPLPSAPPSLPPDRRQRAVRSRLLHPVHLLRRPAALSRPLRGLQPPPRPSRALPPPLVLPSPVPRVPHHLPRSLPHRLLPLPPLLYPPPGGAVPLPLHGRRKRAVLPQRLGGAEVPLLGGPSASSRDSPPPLAGRSRGFLFGLPRLSLL